MKKLILSVFVSMITINFYSQEIPVGIKKSKIFKDEYKHSSIELAEEDNNGGFLIVRSYMGGGFSMGAGYYFEHYDADLNLINEYDYELSKSKLINFSSVLGMILDDNTIHIIDFVYEKNEKAYICSAVSSDINNFEFSKQELFRLDSNEIKRFSIILPFQSTSEFDGDSGASMIINEDKSAFAITVDIKDKNSETHKVFLFDSSLNKKIDHVFKKEIKDKKFHYENIEVSKDGNELYLLGKVFSKEGKKKKQGGKYEYELTKISKNGEETQVFDTAEQYAASLKVITLDNKLVCIGLYSDRKDSRYKGVCYYELNSNDLEMKTSKYSPFTEQFMIDKYGKNKDKELKNLSFRNVITTDNQEIIFNAEEFFITTHTHHTPNGGFYTTYRYHYNDIVSAKLSASGELVWARNINKRQSTASDESYISYTSTSKGNEAYFFINTGDKVKKLRNDRIQFGQTRAKKSNLNVIRINENGDFDFQEILDDKENEVPFMVAHGVVSGNSVFFLGRKGKKKQILKLTL